MFKRYARQKFNNISVDEFFFWKGMSETGRAEIELEEEEWKPKPQRVRRLKITSLSQKKEKKAYDVTCGRGCSYGKIRRRYKLQNAQSTKL